MWRQENEQVSDEETCCGAYLQDTVTSIFVAGTVELSGSKSPIVAMTEVLFYFILINSSESRKFSLRSHLEFPRGYTVLVPSTRDWDTEWSGGAPVVVVVAADGRWSAAEG